jgi:hypothetical protein
MKIKATIVSESCIFQLPGAVAKHGLSILMEQWISMLILIYFNKLYVTKSDILIDVDTLHCVYSIHKFLYPSSCF